MQIFFISDTHFSHTNIIKYCNRPFKTVQEMDLVMIRKWNERVKKGDTVFHLGDFCFSRSTEAPEAFKGDIFNYFKQQLNGELIAIRGNHDNHNKCKSIIENMTIYYGGKRIFMTHNPKYAREDMLNFVGHVHEKWKIKRIGKTGIMVNLSVEINDYKPITINEIFSKIEQWKKNEKMY